MLAMRNSRVLRTIPLLITICLFSFPAQAQYGGGTGEPNDPYLIYTAEQMNAIGVNPDDFDKHFKLMADIDLSGYTGTDFNIIGYYVDWDYEPFTGVFDGNGKKISNFSYTSTDTNDIGLFGYVGRWGEDTVIKDLGLIDPNVDVGTSAMSYGGTDIGSLVGNLQDGTITNCYVEGGNVAGSSWVGGLVGVNWEGTISDCSSTGSVSGMWDSGGLVGGNSSTITNCYATVGVSGNYSVGGLVGFNGYNGTITNCYAIGIISCNSGGGLVGDNMGGAINNCYATGTVSGKNKVGGLVGQNGEAWLADEIFGGTISNCYSTGSVSGENRVGGLVGQNGEAWLADEFFSGTISNCYSTGSVSGTRDSGGLVGLDYYGWFSNSFWDIETSGQQTSAGGMGKTTTEMQMESTFLDAGWDFVDKTANGTEDIWWILEGQDYPRLWWEKEPGEALDTQPVPKTNEEER